MISIVIPVYNIKKYVSHAVNSIFSQTCQDWEIVLVDDGSTDGSSLLCDEMAMNDSRISVIHKENGGLSSSRNAGVKIAQGEYVLFLDGDDVLHPSALSSLCSVISSFQEIDFIQFKYKEVSQYPDGDSFISNEDIKTMVVTSKEQMFQILLDWGGVASSACTKLLKRSLCESIPFKEGMIHEDEDFTTRLLGKAHMAVYCDNEFYYYVKRPGSIINSSFTPARLWAIKALEDRIFYLDSRHLDDLADRFRVKLLSLLVLLYQEAGKANCSSEQILIKQKFQDLSHLNNPYLIGRIKVLSRLSPLIDSLKWYDHFYRAFKYLEQKGRNAKVKITSIIQCWNRRRQLRIKDFTIISNNCWGGFVYQYFGLPYLSPTIGLFIMDDDYIRFLEHFDYYITQPLHFIAFESSKYNDYLSQETNERHVYPIALLDDIEIHFMHYSSEQEAKSKWERRCSRIKKNHMLVKMSQRYIHTEDILQRFEKLPFENKICFTEIEYPQEGFIKIDELAQLNIQGGDETSIVMKSINIIDILNSIH